MRNGGWNEDAEWADGRIKMSADWGDELAGWNWLLAAEIDKLWRKNMPDECGIWRDTI